MLQDLIKAYADAYTAAVTPSRTHRHEVEAHQREALPDAPAKAAHGRGWRALLSAFL